MTHVGFGILRDGKPCGIWPMSRAYVEESISKKKATDNKPPKESHEYVVVSVYIDAHASTLHSPSQIA